VDSAFRPSATPAFNADDVNNVAEYRSLSVMAIISLLIGLASPLCMISPVFMMLPLLGTFLAVITLRQIASSEGRLAGRWAATIGLVLCIGSGTSAFSRNAVVRYVRSARAEEFGREWLTKIITKETEHAFKETIDGTRPPAPLEPGMLAPTSTPYEQFMKNPMVQSVVAAGADAAIELRETQDYVAQSKNDYYVRQRFGITPQSRSTEGDASTPIEVILTLQRSHYRGDRQLRWLVAAFQLAGEASK